MNTLDRSEELWMERRERFNRLAKKRVERALKAIRAVGRLANRNTYAFEDYEGEQIVEALHDDVHEVRQAFEGRKDDKPKGFDFARPVREEDHSL